MSAIVRADAWAALHDPETDAASLAAIAAEHSEFAAQIAAHPNAYPDLIAWARSVARDVPESLSAPAAEPSRTSVGTTEPAVQRSREGSLAGRFWFAAFAGIVVVPFAVQLSGWIGALGGDESAWARNRDFWLWDGIPLLPFGALLLLVFGALAIAGAALGAPTQGRRVGSIVLASLAVVFAYVGAILAIWWWPVWTALELSPAMALLPLVWSSLLFSAWAVSRPIRGAGWAALPIVAVLPFLLEAFAWRHVRYWWGMGSWEQYELRGVATALIGGVLIPALGVLLARRWSAVSERRLAARPATETASVEGVVTVSRTNLMAILSLVFAFLFSVLAVVFGHIALSQIRRTREEGRGLAIAGLVLGYIGVGAWVIVLVFYGATLIALLSYSSY